MTGQETGREEGPAAAGPPPGILIWLVLVILWLTWAPFQPADSLSSPVWGIPGNPAEVVLNILLTVPLGLVMGASGADSPGPTGGRFPWGAFVLVLVVSLVAEAGQAGLASRSASPYDVILNCAGGLAGVALGRRLSSSHGAPALPAILTGTHLYLAAILYALVFAAQLGPVHRLADWRHEFAVVTGEEPDGARQFAGTVRQAEVCAGPAGEELCLAPGADSAARKRLVGLAMDHQRVALRALVESRSERQTGPARLVTFSDGVLVRNATLGVEGRTLVLRLRTPLAGDNGSRVEFHLPDAVPAGRAVRVEGRYEEGLVVLGAHSGGPVVQRSWHYPLLTWTRLFAWRVEDFLPIQVAGALGFGFAVLFLPLGLASGFLATRGIPPGVSASAGVGAAAALALLLTVHLGLPHGLLWTAAAAALAAVGIPLGRLDGRRLPDRRGARP